MEKTSGKPNVTISNSGCEMNEQDKATMVMMTFSNLRRVSFCEVILWCGFGGTYGTTGLNDPKDSCPEALFKGLSNETLATQYQVKSASLNPPRGRRIWLLDILEIPTSTTVRDFNGLKAHYWGQVGPGPDGEPLKLDPRNSSISHCILNVIRSSPLKKGNLSSCWRTMRAQHGSIRTIRPRWTRP